MTVYEFRSQLNQLKGRYSQLRKDINHLRLSINENKALLELHEAAKEVVRSVGIKTQEQLQFHISDITSLALGAVFTNPYTLELEFIQRRNKTECDIFFVRDGEKIDPETASGGGAVDIAAFALRIASWTLQIPKSRNTIILDEPMRFVSENYHEQASAMIKEVSQKLGIQFIIVTHEQTISAYADKVFEVRMGRGKNKGVSKVITK